jgi:hypothetical protein
MTQETAEAIAANTNHCVTGYYFYKFLEGIKVASEVKPIKVELCGEFAQKMGVDKKIIKIDQTGFYDELGNRADDIYTINLILGDVGFKFGVRFKWEVTPEKTKMFVN